MQMQMFLKLDPGVDGQNPNAGFSIEDVDANATRLAIDNNGIFYVEWHPWSQMVPLDRF